MKTRRVNENLFENGKSIGHFRVPKTLTFKMRPGAQSFLWKWVLFAWERKMISISTADHLPSFWNRGPGKLGNGLFWWGYPLVLKRSVVNLGRNIGRLPFTTVTLPFKKDILHFSIPVLHSRHWIPPHPKQYLVDLSKVIDRSTKYTSLFILPFYPIIV